MKVILVMAVTADGKIARHSNHAVDWSGKADKAYFSRISRKAGVVIMGANTFDTLGAPLPDRLNIVMTGKKHKKPSFPDVIFTDEHPGQILRDLEEKKYPFAVLMGGAQINSLFMDKGLVDEMHLTLVPRIFGTGLGLFHSPVGRKLALESSREIEPGHLLMKFRLL